MYPTPQCFFFVFFSSSSSSSPSSEKLCRQSNSTKPCKEQKKPIKIFAFKFLKLQMHKLAPPSINAGRITDHKQQRQQPQQPSKMQDPLLLRRHTKRIRSTISRFKTLTTKLPKYSEQLRKEQNGFSLVAAKLREGCPQKNVAYVSDAYKSLPLRARFLSSLFSRALSLSLSLISSLSLPSKEMFGKWSKFVLHVIETGGNQVLRNQSHFTVPH
jgi:hypothetical protein